MTSRPTGSRVKVISAPIADRGSLWRYDAEAGLWKAIPPETLRAEIGRRYLAKTCKRYGDYRAIAEYVLDVAAAPGSSSRPQSGA